MNHRVFQLAACLSLTAVASAVMAQAAAPESKSAAPAAKAWSPYVAVTAPAVPVVKQKGWVRTPVDAFVLARLETAGLKPSPEADRAAYIRRATLDA